MNDITITFKEDELITILADYYGYETSEIDLNNFTEDDIHDILIDLLE